MAWKNETNTINNVRCIGVTGIILSIDFNHGGDESIINIIICDYNSIWKV